MPPTRAAASSTASGRYSSNQRLTVGWSRRSTASRPIVKIRHSSCLSRRISAEPTMPRWPATNMRRARRGKSVGDVMSLVPSRHRGASGGVGKPSPVHGPLAAGECDIVLDHHLDQLWEANPRLPVENVARLGWIATQGIDLGRPEIATVDLDMALPVEASRREGELDQIAHAVRLPGRYDVVVGFLLLQHQPHRLDIVAGKAPIALRFEISKIELVLKTLSDSADRAGNLSRDEGLATARALMIE